MEETQDLLSDLIPKEPELDEYRKSYRSVKIVSRVALLLAILVYMCIMPGIWKSNEKSTAYLVGEAIGTIIGSCIGFVLIAAIPALVLAAPSALLMSKKFLYKERFKKAFWFAMMGISVLILFFTIIQIFQYGQISVK